MPEVPSYRYAATITRWVDGDTVDVDLDLGFYITVSTRLRLYGIDTPEVHVPAQKARALVAKARVVQLAPTGTSVVVSTYKTADKYGRWLAVMHVGDVDVASTLLAEKLAVPYFGGTKEVFDGTAS